MGEMADWDIEQGMAAEAAHERGECDYGCPLCAEAERRERERAKRNRKRRLARRKTWKEGPHGA